MTARLLAIAVCTALLCAAACSGGEPDGAGGPDGDRRKEAASASGDARPELPEASRFRVPKGFDNAHGWTEAVSAPDSRTHGSWAVAPKSGVFVQVMNAGGKVHARALDGGEELWTFRPKVRLEDARTDVHVTADADGEEFAVVVRRGRTAADGLERAQVALTVDTVPVSSSGAAGAVRHKRYDNAEAGPFTGRLVVTGDSGSGVWLLDPLTGRHSKVDGIGEVGLSGCRKQDMPPSARCSADTAVEFATSAGAVSSYTQDGFCDYRWQAEDWVPCGEGFTVGTAWRSEKAAPAGAAEATPLAVAADHLVVLWSMFPDAGSEEAAGRDVVAVHALADGKLLARADCDITGPDSGQGSVRPLAAQHTTGLSPNGRFLVSGQVGFDLNAKSGVCFAGTAKRRGVTLTSVSDTGRAYGVSYTESTWADVPYGTFPHDFGSQGVSVPGRAVAADVRSGNAEQLPPGTALPVHLAKDTGLFLTSGTLAAHPAGD